jgi:FAD dependent oxidoreductase TIGR03364
MGSREPTAKLSADVCVIGAGILGLALAFEARARGLTVVVLERDLRAVGASVRNFGHVFIGALADGEDLQRGLRARRRWLELGARAGLSVWEAGTLIAARALDELAVLEFAAANAERAGRMLSAEEAAALAPIATEGLLGALHSTLDLRVDPRVAVAALAALLAEDPGARLRFATPVHRVEPGLVRARGLIVKAPVILACPGPALDGLAELQPALEALTLCSLQMLRASAPRRARFAPALATGLSLIRYPAFAAAPAAECLRRRLMAERPELLQAGIHLLITQLSDGDLIVGDTHDYGQTPSPFRQERSDQLLLAEARRLLGAARLRVRERWLGIYPSLAGAGHVMSASPMPDVHVVQVLTGLGMTVSFGWAPGVLEAALAAADHRSAAESAPASSATPGS